MNKAGIFSFDIFDTLITRATAFPQGIFFLVQKNIQSINIPDFLKENFYTIRTEAENYVQEKLFFENNYFDCNLDEIYEIIKVNYNLSEIVINQIKNIEIETEIKNIVPIWENINKVKKLISENKKVILISDMYLDSETLRKMLTRIDAVFKNIEIYTSSETRKRKSNGSLYRLIKEKYKTNKILHTGDNEFSDVIQPKWNRLKSIKFIPERLKKYELELLSQTKDNINEQILIGIAKSIRQNNKKSKTFDFAVSYAAPILYSYVDWIIKQAQMRKIKNLYFVARDGYVLKIIADIILKTIHSDIQTHYFYGSRKASRIPDSSNIETFINQVFLELKDLMSPEFIAGRFNIQTDDLKKFADINLPISDWGNVLQKNEEFKKLVINANKNKKEMFLKYIAQEIDFSNPDFAFVDLNGSGRTQDGIQRLIQANFGYNNPICSFYCIIQTDMVQSDKSIKLAYLHKAKIQSIVLELLCRTLDGQTLGYKEENNKIVPILEFENNKFLAKWGYEDYIDGIKTFSKTLIKYKQNNNIEISNMNLLIEYIKYLFKNPDRELSEIIGAIPFGVYGDESKIKECAPKYNLFNIFTNKTVFKEIALSRTNKIIKPIVRFILFMLKKTNYGFISPKRELAYIRFFRWKINIRELLWK